MTVRRSGSAPGGGRITTRRHHTRPRITENSLQKPVIRRLRRQSPYTGANDAQGRTRVTFGGHAGRGRRGNGRRRAWRARAFLTVAALTAVTFTAGCAALG